MIYYDVNETAKRWHMNPRRVEALCREKRILGAIKEGRQWRIPETAESPLDGRTKEYAKEKMSFNPSFSLSEIHAQDPTERTLEAFKSLYQKAPESLSFTPYRICPVGAHTDHQHGLITGFAIDKGIHIAYSAQSNGVVEVFSLQFPQKAQWHVSSVPPEKQNDWADHLRGATIALSHHHPLRTGLYAVVNGELPIGGLSSSAAVIITFLSCLCKLNNISLSPEELITISREAENNYVGVSCGTLDQSCEVYCQKNKLLFLDTLDNSHELIPANPSMKPFEIVIFFSGIERTLATSKYNKRVDECRSAAYALKAFADLPYGKFSDCNLRDVPFDIFQQYKDKLPGRWARRAEHWYGEMNRVKQAVKAWKQGNIEEFGKLSFESGASSINLWETGSPELIKLYEIMTRVKGIYGGRFSGAGFKGCCIAIIDPEHETEILSQVETEYLRAFPHLKNHYSAYVCKTADGVKL